MVVDLVLLLSAAASDSLVKFIVLSSNSPAAYCAGGDIKALTADPIGYVADFFSVEFNLNFLLSRIDKPVIALLNGITMGGGVGISVYAHYRVGQQNKFVFAMPESGIGLFTDIGGGWFLPKNSPSIGVANYIGMLGARLDTKDALYAHAITHVATQDEFKKLKDQLCQVSVPNSAYETGKTHQIVKKVLDAVHVADDNGKLSLQRDWIDKTFDAISVEQIIENLKQKSGDQAQDQWGEKTLKDLLSKSPTSIKVTFETIRRGSKGASLQDVLTTDYRLGSRLVKANDFREGVRAVVVEKKNDPKWSPNSIDQVHDDYIRELFDEPLEQEIQFYMLH
jgi:enoyl-CoA hydratase/carnithine racemase